MQIHRFFVPSSSSWLFWFDSKTGSRRPKSGPRWCKTAQVRPKMAPRCSKMAPRWLQKGPRWLKTVPLDSLGEGLGPKNLKKRVVFFQVFANAGFWYHQALHGTFGSFLAPPWAVLGLSWGRPGAVLGRSWGVLGRLGPVLGLSWGCRGRVSDQSWAVLGSPGVLGLSWAVLGLTPLKMPPRWPQDGPSKPQDGPKMGPCIRLQNEFPRSCLVLRARLQNLFPR